MKKLGFTDLEAPGPVKVVSGHGCLGPKAFTILA